MANCTSYTLAGLNVSCKNSLGGISEVYIAKYSDLWKTKVENRKVIPYLHRGTTFYKFELRKRQASFTSTFNTNQNGSNYYTNAITMNFSKMDYIKRNLIMALVGTDVIVLFKDNNGKIWFLGKDEPVQVTEASGNTGAANSDANAYTITLTEESREIPFEVSENIYDGVGIDWTQEYLTFETTLSGTNIFLYAPDGNPDEENPIILQVSINKITWHNVQVTDEINLFATAFGLQSFNAGTKIYVKGLNRGFTYDDICVSLVCDKPTYVYGNLISTLDGNRFRTIQELPLGSVDPSEAWGEFAYLFYSYSNWPFQYNNQILSHPTKELTMPIYTIFSMGTFASMFQNCTLLEQAPYIVMDEGGSESYGVFTDTFKGCSNLSYIRCEELVVSETLNWVLDVSTNGTFVTNVPNQWPRGNSGIPNNWQLIKK